MLRTILRKCHTHTKTEIKQKNLTFFENFLVVTAGHIVVFGGANSVYYGYNAVVNNNKLKLNHKNTDNHHRIIDEAIFQVVSETFEGFVTGIVLGFMWPVTYVVYANVFYHKYANTISSNDNDTILP